MNAEQQLKEALEGHFYYVGGDAVLDRNQKACGPMLAPVGQRQGKRACWSPDQIAWASQRFAEGANVKTVAAELNEKYDAVYYLKNKIAWNSWKTNPDGVPFQ